MEALLNKMYADHNIKGDKTRGNWGDQLDHLDQLDQLDQKVNTAKTVKAMYEDPPLAYMAPTYTQAADGKFYLGYPIAVMQEAPKKAVRVLYGYGTVEKLSKDMSHLDPSMTASETSSEMTETTELDLTSESSEEECAELTYIGKFAHHAGWFDTSKNYGFVTVEEPVMDMTRFITFDVPTACKRGDTVRFMIVPNKRGKDACKAVITEVM